MQLPVSHNKKGFILDCKEVIYIDTESHPRGIYFHTSSSSSPFVRTIRELCGSFKHTSFVRINSGILVNSDFVLHYDKDFHVITIPAAGDKQVRELPVSETYQKKAGMLFK